MSTRRIKASLLSLPDELLSAIFSEVVYSDGSRTAAFALTCRRLAPIVRQEVYRNLQIGEDRTEFGLLAELCAKRPDLRALVQVLQIERPKKEHEAGGMCTDYTAEHPCINLLHSRFPALHTLTICHAHPADIFITLTRLAATTGPKIQRLALSIAPDPVLDGKDVHQEIWWHLLARLPTLADLAFDFGPVRIAFNDGRAVSPLQGLHSLTLYGEPWDLIRGPTLAALFPNLRRLRLDCATSAELQTLLRRAPTSVTRLVLSVRWDLSPPLRSDALARFPLLEQLSLCRLDATPLLPSIRTSRISYIHLSFGAELVDQDLLSLVDGHARMKQLKAIQLGYMPCEVYRWSKRKLVSALRRDTRYDLAQVKASLRPNWPHGSAEGLREVTDAARKNGIEVYGTAVDCLDWSDRFDEHVEHFLVDDALASNDYTMIERYLGEDGAGKAILRQRPRLAELVRKSMT